MLLLFIYKLLYRAPSIVIYSEAFTALAYMMLNVIMSECFQLIVNKIKQSNLKESPEAGSRTRMEPANRILVES